MISDIVTHQRAKAYYETHGLPQAPNGDPISFEEAFTTNWMAAQHLLAESFAEARANFGEPND